MKKQTLAVMLRQWRTTANLRQRMVGAHLGVTIQCVSNWETGRTRPSSRLMVPLAKYSGLDLATLLEAK